MTDDHKISMQWLQDYIDDRYKFYSEEMGMGARAFLWDLRCLNLIREERIEWDYESDSPSEAKRDRELRRLDEMESRECRWDDEQIINGEKTLCCSKHPNCENSFRSYQQKQKQLEMKYDEAAKGKGT